MQTRQPRAPAPRRPAIQTFLPYADFADSAAVLDTKRLGKQRVENLQIFQVLVALRWNRSSADAFIEVYEPKAWRNHPAVRGWRGHEAALVDYQRVICAEWALRGFKDTCAASTVSLLAASGCSELVVRPAWTFDPAVHRSHQSNLIRKDPDFYTPLFPGVPADLDYVWPA
ncbi:MAG TPA: MSMEG_6728 family protein [Propionibacteriaceae bacterium]